MLGRFGSLRTAAPLLGLLIGLAATGDARAHRLEADYRILPGQQVRIESWFDATGDSPKGATVEVFGADHQLLASGELDADGRYVFSFHQAEPLKVVVSAGGGHRKELAIPTEELARSLAGEATGPKLTGTSSFPEIPPVDRSSRVTAKDVLVGISFLLAAAAFVLSVRNARQLKALNRRGP